MKEHNMYIKELIETLSNEGMRLIEKAYNTRDFTNRTYNLHDSYGSAVYYNGKLQKDTIYTFSQNAEKPKKWYGRTIRGSVEIIDFLNSYVSKDSGLELILVAAMPYATILEEGSGNMKAKYRVISSVKQDLDILSGDYNGNVMRITNN